MQLIFLVIQIILAVAIVGAILLQKNGGDGLGSLGGGGGISGNHIISGRTSANFLTKGQHHSSKSVVEKTILNESAGVTVAPQAPTSE